MPVLLALSAAVAWGTADFLGGFASRRGGRVHAVTLSIQLAGLFSIIPVALLIGGRLTFADFWWGFMGGLGSGTALYMLYVGFTKSHTGVVAPIAAIGTAAVPALFGLATGETLSGYQTAGVLIGLVAIWLVSRPGTTSGDGLDSGVGVVYGVAAGMGFALMFISLDQLSADSGAWGVVPVRLAGALLMLSIAGRRRLPMVPGGGIWPAIIVSGFLGSMGNAAFIVATRLGNLSIVAVVGSLFPAATVTLAYLFLHERLSPLQLLGVGAALTAVGLVSTG